MSWNNCEILCVYPHDRTTFFLGRIVSFLKNNLADKFHCHKVKLNEASHQDCLRRLDSLEKRVIIFLGHGKSDVLYGACGGEGESVLGIHPEAVEYNPQYFNKPNFITIENSNILSKNIVFALSCDSNILKNSIGYSAIENGTISFIGFGDIQTDYDDERELTKREIAIFKGIIVKIIKKSLLYSLQNKFTVEKLVDTIKIMTNKEIYKLLTVHKGIKYRHRIAKHLYSFKDEIEIFGDKYIQLTK